LVQFSERWEVGGHCEKGGGGRGKSKREKIPPVFSEAEGIWGAKNMRGGDKRVTPMLEGKAAALQERGGSKERKERSEKRGKSSETKGRSLGGNREAKEKSIKEMRGNQKEK